MQKIDAEQMFYEMPLSINDSQKTEKYMKPMDFSANKIKKQISNFISKLLIYYGKVPVYNRVPDSWDISLEIVGVFI